MVNYGPFEVCFVVDLGDSMETWFKIFKKVAIREILKFQDSCHGYIKVHAAFVGYRTNIEQQPFVVFEFTNNLLHLEQKINQIKCYGAHQCKSMRDAYEIANNLEWKNYAGGIMIHLGNSPPYGIKYHNQTIYDLYPSIKPPGIPLEYVVERLAFKGIDLVIFQFHECMNIVVNIIEKEYNKTKRVNCNEIVVFNNIKTELQFEHELVTQLNKQLVDLLNSN